ncbi:MAG TPA: hypothetical protein VIQ02_05475 [Jiangellaceae bacterium]|jgi:hypothetical protein
MAAVLVSGTADSAGAVASALRELDADVTEVPDLDGLAVACEAAGESAFDAYVQLPVTFEMVGDTVVRRVHHFYSAGVLARFVALATVLPTLRTEAKVIFVLGALRPEVGSNDDLAARRSLLNVLGHAARADAPEKRLAVRVLSYSLAPEAIGRAALGRDSSSAVWLEEVSRLRYDDWRTELLGMIAVEA